MNNRNNTQQNNAYEFTERDTAWLRLSRTDPDRFWDERAREYLHWDRSWDKVQDCDFHAARIAWFPGGKLNVSVNCLDRHLAERSHLPAILWVGDHPEHSRTITYAELHRDVCRLANSLLSLGISRGDRVCIYLPMIPEAAVAMLACSRIGAVHSVVFAGFSAESLKDRIMDSGCKVLICADEGRRHGQSTPLKNHVDTALAECPQVSQVIVVRHTGGAIAWRHERDIWYHECMASASDTCPAASMDACDPLFILYTSGSTGKPKGIVHACGGYLLYAGMTHHKVFDYRKGDVYWCTADIGWITGHTYVVYGPLANGATTVMFEGVPAWPTPDRLWNIIDEHNISVFYTAPTVIRSLMAYGNEHLKSTHRSSLRVLGSVGEPINPEAWQWYFSEVGHGKTAVVDTWWQTETGGILITPLPCDTHPKPGSASTPFYGIEPAILSPSGTPVTDTAEGALVISASWPGQAIGIHNDPDRFRSTYFDPFPGYYFSGDGARQDNDGHYWITGRIDDVINVSGHRLGTAEIESALVLHPQVAEAAVVGFPHDIKGQAIHAFITLMQGAMPSDKLAKELNTLVRHEISAIACPERIQWVSSLPKTRSGKIMRRLLRKIAANDLDQLGDTSTLSDPQVLEEIIQNVPKPVRMTAD
ncbi:MAG: acetyl-CoA synthase [Pseudomonadota bacterium]|jgi:acetyl-CoA synthetase